MDAAEARARELLREVVGAEAFAAYERFGFLTVVGANPRYAYLVYPYRPLVAYETASGELLSEFCIRFDDDGERLPPADDVLARWMAIRGGERELIGQSNLNRPGRQVDPDQARRDIARIGALPAAA